MILFVYTKSYNYLKSEITGKRKQVYNWFMGFVDYARSEYQKGQKGISIDFDEDVDTKTKRGVLIRKPYMMNWFLDECDQVYDFRSPCQIEVFWLRYPELQLILVTHFYERPDKEIILNGPYYSNEFIDKIEHILKESRWSKPEQSTYVTSALIYFVAFTKKYIFDPMEFKTEGDREICIKNAATHVGQALGNRCYAGIFTGNMAKWYSELNMAPYDLRFKEIEQDMKAVFEIMRNLNAPDNPYYRSYTGYGVHFFPPINVGKDSGFSIREILLDPLDVLTSELYHPSSDPNNYVTLNQDFNQYRIIVKDDGFICVLSDISIKDHHKKDNFGIAEFEDNIKYTTTMILNVIMSLGVLAGLDLFVVKEHDLVKVRYREYCDAPAGFSVEEFPRMSTIRSMFYFHKDFRKSALSDKPIFSGFKMKKMEEKILENIINQAANVFSVKNHERLIEDLNLLIDAYTNFRNKDYYTSFILSWIIIEGYITEQWIKYINDNSEKTTHVMLKDLNDSYKIEKSRFDKLMELKTKRNRLIHRGVKALEEDAMLCLNTSRDILTEKESLNEFKDLFIR